MGWTKQEYMHQDWSFIQDIIWVLNQEQEEIEKQKNKHG